MPKFPSFGGVARSGEVVLASDNLWLRDGITLGFAVIAILIVPLPIFEDIRKIVLRRKVDFG